VTGSELIARFFGEGAMSGVFCGCSKSVVFADGKEKEASSEESLMAW
jgi:hypothetical protein